MSIKRKYAILNSSEKHLLDYSCLLQSSPGYVNENANKTMFVIKWNCTLKPNFLTIYGGVCNPIEINGRTLHSKEEILEIIGSTAWYE